MISGSLSLRIPIILLDLNIADSGYLKCSYERPEPTFSDLEVSVIWWFTTTPTLASATFSNTHLISDLVRLLLSSISRWNYSISAD